MDPIERGKEQFGKAICVDGLVGLRCSLPECLVKELLCRQLSGSTDPGSPPKLPRLAPPFHAKVSALHTL